MTRQRRRMRPVVVLLSAAMVLVYASAGVDVDGGPELVASVDAPPALSVANRIAQQAQAVPASQTSSQVPTQVEPEEVADVVAIPPDNSVGEAEAAAEVYPVRIRIPAISVDAAVVDLGLNQDGTLEVPADFDVAGLSVNHTNGACWFNLIAAQLLHSIKDCAPRGNHILDEDHVLAP